MDTEIFARKLLKLQQFGGTLFLSWICPSSLSMSQKMGKGRRIITPGKQFPKVAFFSYVMCFLLVQENPGFPLMNTAQKLA